MGRYSSYGIATIFVIPLDDLDDAIKSSLYGKTIADLNIQDLSATFPKEVYDIDKTEKAIVITLKERFNGNDIYSLLKDFSMISPNKGQLSPEVADEIGNVIKDKPLEEVMKLAEKGNFECFQTFKLPYYLYYTPIQISDKRIYVRTMVHGILIAYSYSKTITEDDTVPYDFLTSLLRYRLKENPLSPTLLAYLSV